MSSPFLGAISLVAFNFAPRGYAFCNGQLLPISQNTALFSLLGTTYGGNGQSTFALPNLQSRVAISSSSGYVLGSTGGAEAVTLSVAQLPQHTHTLTVSSSSSPLLSSPIGNTLGSPGPSVYASSANDVMNAATVTNAGGVSSHENRPPFLVLNYVIAMQGIFPSRN